MKPFFSSSVLEKIKKNESDPFKIKNFLSNDEVTEILNYRNSISKRMVDREESTKIPFNWGDSELLRDLKKKIENRTGEFTVKDFEPHFITTRFPLRLHADTGKDPNDVIFKNIVVPLEINYQKNTTEKKFSHTLVFKNRWYEKSALFTTKTKNNYDFIIKDINGNFVDIIDIFDFKLKVEKKNNDKIIYEDSEFFVDENFKDYISSLSKTKRYNQRTDKHIINNIELDLKIYEKYMTHQPFEDCMGLEIDKALAWESGSLLCWDRTRIHSSDNFLKNGIHSKTCIALFSSK